MKNIIPVVLLAIVCSCSGKNDLPKGILKPSKMTAVFWDYIRSDVYVSNYIKPDTAKNATLENLKLQKSIFKQHQVTKEEFYRSYTYYANHKELMTEMIDSIIAKQQRDTTKKPIIKSEIKEL